jgi:cystathionine beta-lyase/cystathionine gamma-synthase
MASSNPAPLSPKHPLLRLVGRQALALAAEEHAADLAEWRHRLTALHGRLTTTGAPPDWAWAAAELQGQLDALNPAEPWHIGLDRVIAGYRRLLKLVVGWETADSWQSPAVADSGIRQRAAHQEPVLAFQNDYQRYALPVVKAEAALQALHLPIGSVKPRTWLVSSGMSALATLLQALAEEAGTWVGGTHLYFESQRLLAGRNVHWVDETRAGDLFAAIRQTAPPVVVVDGLANSSRLPVTDLGPVVAALAGLPGPGMRTLVVDTTLLGPAFGPSDWLRALPANVRLVTYRSLQKLDQHGLDLTTGGEITVWSAGPWNLEGWRQLCGALPTEVGLNLLPLPDRAAWLARFNRHERNTRLLAAWLMDLRSPWLAKVHVADAGRLGDHIGPLFWADWADALDGADAQRFCHFVVETARSLNVPFAYGSSFGFATSRMAAFTRSGGTGTALRLAPGVENLARLALVSDALQGALTQFGSHLADSYRQDAATGWFRRWRDAGQHLPADLQGVDECRTALAVLTPLVELSARCACDPALQALGRECHDRLIAPLAGRLAATVARDGEHAAALQAVAQVMAPLAAALSPPQRRWWQR